MKKHEPSICLRCRYQPLVRIRPMAHLRKHLRTLEHQLDGSSQFSCGKHREDGVRPGRPLAPEATTKKFCDYPHLVQRKSKERGKTSTVVENALSGIVDKKSVVAPCSDCGVRLHRVVMLERRRVGRIDRHRCPRGRFS